MIDGINNIPVAIVGGGPVGLLLALFLDLYGVRSVIFNSDPEVRRHPKGSTHNSRTMEHHRRLGIAPRSKKNEPTTLAVIGWKKSRRTCGMSDKMLSAARHACGPGFCVQAIT
jgi:2-polyprenyl-6-methoxyphenol hydroxylase-like FAD-dependent oxidoreductase